MPHKIPNPSKDDYKKDDRAQHAVSGKYGTVYQNQGRCSNVHVCWDAEPFVVRVEPSHMIWVAPWHEISFDEARSLLTGIDPVHLRNFTEAGLIMSGAVKAQKQGDTVNAGFQYKDGDRVKLKYRPMCGTVVGDRVQAGVYVHWDKHPEGHRVATPVADLVPLHAPRDTDPVNPNQEAIDAIEALRVPLKQEIEALQQKLSHLTQAKKLLERD